MINDIKGNKDDLVIGDINGLNNLINNFHRFIIRYYETLIQFKDEYLEKRSDAWSHRKKSSGYISGTIKYEVLKRASFRCELCGISADEKGLEVDHIVPRNKGGSDDTSNLQSLCYSTSNAQGLGDQTRRRRRFPPYVPDRHDCRDACACISPLRASMA